MEIVKILFECSSITPSESCGVEMFLYSLLSGFQQLEYGDELFVNIPPGTRDKYEDVVDGSVVNLVEDQWQKHLLRIDGDCFSPGKVFFIVKLVWISIVVDYPWRLIEQNDIARL